MEQILPVEKYDLNRGVLDCRQSKPWTEHALALRCVRQSFRLERDVHYAV